MTIIHMNQKEANFWNDFIKNTGVDNPRFGSSWSFGNTSETANELAQLVLAGKKQQQRVQKVNMIWLKRSCLKRIIIMIFY